MAGRLRYDFLDFYGLSLGLIIFSMILFFSYLLLKKYDLDRRAILQLLSLSALGHFLGALVYYWFTLKAGSDSVYYFEGATTSFNGLGYFFACFILGLMRTYLIGDSFLAAFFFFGALGLLASVFYLVTFKILLDRLSSTQKFYLRDPKILFYPALLLLCWPSYFFWSAGLVKDSFAFLSIAMFLSVIVQESISISGLALLILASFLGFFVRPYLFVIFFLSAIIYALLGSKWNVFVKTAFLGFFVIVSAIAMPYLIEYADSISFNGSVQGAGQYVVRQQQTMGIGSSIPIPTHNPRLIFFFLPYFFLANLFLPLGIGAGNLIGAISSVENMLLTGWIIFLFRNRLFWKVLKEKLMIVKFLMLFFLIGMSCLSIMSTNLGLSMREKMMYVPALLVCIFLVYAFKRITFMQISAAQQMRPEEWVAEEVPHTI